MKKLLLSLGGVMAITAPVVVAVSCDNGGSSVDLDITPRDASYDANTGVLIVYFDGAKMNKLASEGKAVEAGIQYMDVLSGALRDHKEASRVLISMGQAVDPSDTEQGFTAQNLYEAINNEMLAVVPTTATATVSSFEEVASYIKANRAGINTYINDQIDDMDIMTEAEFNAAGSHSAQYTYSMYKDEMELSLEMTKYPNNKDEYAVLATVIGFN